MEQTTPGIGTRLQHKVCGAFSSLDQLFPYLTKKKKRLFPIELQHIIQKSSVFLAITPLPMKLKL